MSFAHLLNSTITYKAITGRDANTDPTLGAAVTIPSYNDKERKVVRNSKGDEAVTSDIVTSDTEIPESCYIWVPPDAPDDVEGREPIYVASFEDPTNPTLTLWEAGLGASAS